MRCDSEECMFANGAEAGIYYGEEEPIKKCTDHAERIMAVESDSSTNIGVAMCDDPAIMAEPAQSPAKARDYGTRMRDPEPITFRSMVGWDPIPDV